MKLEKRGKRRIKILCTHTQMQVKSGTANWKKDKENHRPPLNPNIFNFSAEQHHKILEGALMPRTHTHREPDTSNTNAVAHKVVCISAATSSRINEEKKFIINSLN